MKQEDIDDINELSEEQGHRLRLEQGCLDEYWNDDLLIPDADLPLLEGENTFEREECMDPTMPRSEKSYAEDEKELEVIVGAQLQNVAKALNGHVIYQTVVNQDGTSYKRIIIEYEIKHE